MSLLTAKLIQFLFSLLTTISGWIIKKILENKPKLIAFYGHASENTLKDANGKELELENGCKAIVRTHSISIVNIGTLAAKKVRIIHGELPLNYNIYPPVNYKVEGKEILIPSLTPREQITITYLYYPPSHVAQINLLIKSEECLAIPGNMQHVDVKPAWLRFVTYVLLFIGLVTVVYLVTDLVLFYFHICTFPLS